MGGVEATIQKRITSCERGCEAVAGACLLLPNLPGYA